jgi:hypothetical protein
LDLIELDLIAHHHGFLRLRWRGRIGTRHHHRRNPAAIPFTGYDRRSSQRRPP